MGWALGVVAGLTWVGTLYQVRSLLRRSRDPVIRYYWLSLLFISLALTFAVPTVYAAIDGLARVPNLSKLLANGSAVLAALSVQSAVYLSLVSEHNSFRP